MATRGWWQMCWEPKCSPEREVMALLFEPGRPTCRTRLSFVSPTATNFRVRSSKEKVRQALYLRARGGSSGSATALSDPYIAKTTIEVLDCVSLVLNNSKETRGKVWSTHRS